MKKEELKLTAEEVQEQLLKVTIQNNKKLYSINYTLNFIGICFLIGVLLIVLSFLGLYNTRF